MDAFSFDIETPHGKKTIAVFNPVVPEVNAIKMELEKFCDAIINNTPTHCIGSRWLPGDGYRSSDPAKNKTQYDQHLTVHGLSEKNSYQLVY